MAEKTLNTRIILKHDSESNWDKATDFIPRTGEIVIYDIDNEHKSPRIKVGDGINIPSNLPFLKDGDFGLSKKAGGILNEYSISETNILVCSAINAIQAGEGDPSPTNIRPITGWDVISVSRTGKNLLGFEDCNNPSSGSVYIDTCENGAFKREVKTDHTTTFAISNPAIAYIINPNIKAGTYTFTLEQIAGPTYNKPYLQITLNDGTIVNLQNGEPTTITQDGTITGVRMTSKSFHAGDVIEFVMQLEEGEATEYQPYNGQTITAELPETVYGGTYDWKTGTLTVTHINKVLRASDVSYKYGVSGNPTLEGWATSCFVMKADTTLALGRMTSICSHFKNTFASAYTKEEAEHGMFSDHPTLTTKYFAWGTPSTTITEFQNWLEEQYAAGTPVTLMTLLKEPYTIQLSPQTMKAVEGYNAVWSNCGNTTAVFNWCQNEVTNYLGTETVGSSTNPIYLNGGKPEACSYELNATVPSDAKFTDTTYSAATTSEEGLMSAADKKALEAYKCYNLGSFSGKTIADLRSSLETWASSVINYPGATAKFSAGGWISLWDQEDLTTTLSAGGVWLVTLDSSYTANTYLQLRMTNYYSRYVYYVSRENGVWKEVHKVFFDSSTLTANQLPASGVTAGTYGLDAAASPAHGGKFMVPKIVVDDKGRVTSAAEYEITLPADTNTDTGATSVTVTGSGNAVTEASYDADTRKLTLTKGATYNNYSHPTGNAPSKASGLYKFSTDATSHVNSVTAVTKADITALGIPELDSAGKIPSSQLPSYVDDVLEYSAKSNFPTTGETGKIYVDTSTNKTYRWSGSAYTEISSSLALGETSSTAYYGDKGAAAYAHAVTNKGVAKTSGLYKITTNSEGHVTAGTAVVKEDITALGIPAQDTTYSVATTSAAGLMSVADKKLITALTTDAITFSEEKTVASLRAALESWATSSYYKPGAMGQFVCGSDWMDYWNDEDLTTTLTGGIRWLVTLESYYTSSDYLLLKFTNYSTKRVYYAARMGTSGWRKVSQVFFNDSTLKATQLPTSGVNAGTYGPEAAAAPEPGEKILIPKVVVDDKGRITSAATYEITLPADTDTKVNVTLGTTTKAYLLGVSETPTSTATGRTAIADTGVYLDTAAGRLRSASVSTDTLVSATGTAMYIKPGSTLYIQSAASTSLIFQPQGTERARFDTNGNFLIKTTLQPGTNDTYNLGTSSYKWKNVYATTFIGALTGNADTATKLASSFTLSLGAGASGSVTIDGSQNRTLSVTGLKETYLSWGGRAIKGSVSPLDAAMSSIHNANRFAFAKPAGIIIEYSNDAGVTWNDYTTTDAQKIRLVSGIGSSYKIGGPDKATGTHTINDQLRISLIAKDMGVYTSLQKILLNITTNYATGSQVKVEHSTYGAQTTFVEDGIHELAGWSGWNSIPIGASFGSTISANWYMIRLTFSVTGVNSDTAKNSALTIIDITGHGPTYWGFPSSMAKTGHLYTYDENQAAIFAGAITVKNTSMYINGETAESVANIGFQLQHNGNSIGKLFCSKAGTTSQGGTCQLVLGNAKNSTSNYNARGSIMMYSEAATGVILLAHTINTNYYYYFRDHDQTVYSVGTTTRSAVGSASVPVYINNKGIVTACTSIAAGTANADGAGNIIADTYLKLSGGTVSGEVNSSATVNTSSAAFRNIKVLAPGTEVVAGTTAIPTGEIWVSYEE